MKEKKLIAVGRIAAIDGKNVTVTLPREIAEHPSFGYREGETLRLKWEATGEHWYLGRRGGARARAQARNASVAPSHLGRGTRPPWLTGHTDLSV